MADPILNLDPTKPMRLPDYLNKDPNIALSQQEPQAEAPIPPTGGADVLSAPTGATATEAQPQVAGVYSGLIGDQFNQQDKSATEEAPQPQTFNWSQSSGFGDGSAGMASWHQAFGEQQTAQPEAATQGAYEVASMVDKVVGITPETIEGQTYEPVEVAPAEQAEVGGYEATGYEPTLAPEAEGYEAQGYEAEGYEALQGVAKTTQENVSQAIERITGADSPIMQRAVAQAVAEANRRGLLNSSMAAGAAQGAILDRAFQIAQGDVQNEQFNVAQQNAMEAQNVQMGNEALRFSADARNRASEFMANAQNQAAQFLAAERNQNGRFNAEQSNRAAEFSANAQNQAAQFAAAAENQASIFNAGEANRMSMFTAEQANTAARFAAEMSQAASQFNATAFNQAQQRYADAMNAALAAEVDATNLSRRDLAMFKQQAEQNALDRANRLQAAEISAGASVAAASISASASMANAQAQREFSAGQAALDREFRASENELQRDFSREQMGANAYNSFVSSVGSIMTNPNLTDEGRQNAVETLAALHNGNPYAQVDINLGGGG